MFGLDFVRVKVNASNLTTVVFFRVGFLFVMIATFRPPLQTFHGTQTGRD